MNKPFSQWSGLTLLLTSILFVGCDTVNTPSKEQVEVHLQNQLPLFLKLVGTEQKSFPNTQQKGSGRTSVSGQVELASDLYALSDKIIGHDLEKAGIPPLIGMQFMPRKLQRRGYVYYVSERAGKRIQFESEVSYWENTDGFKFLGSPNINISGIPRGKLESNYVIHNSPEYLQILNEIQSGAKQFQEMQERAKRAMDGFFQATRPLTYKILEREGSFDETFRLKTHAPIQFSNSPFSPLYLEFHTQGEVTWIKNGRMGKSQFKANDVVPVSIMGTIYGWADPSKPQVVKVGIHLPDPLRPGSFYSTTNSMLTWSGTDFQWVWTNGSVHATLQSR